MKANVIINGEILTPDPIGKKQILTWDGKIARIAPKIDIRGLDLLKVEYEVIDAEGCYVVPGLIDPHAHLMGASGEKGFNTQTPPLFLQEVIEAGLTSIVGTLGVNTSTSNMFSLYARAMAMKEDGISAFIYSGGYDVPPMCMTESVRTDLLYIEEVIGMGELAISDERSVQPRPDELARAVADTYVGGILSGKAGITHFHVGEGSGRLKILKDLIRDHDIRPESLYPSHVERTAALMREAIDLARKGAAVDIDTVEEDLHKWLSFYFQHRGPPKRLTVSSDAHYCGPVTRFNQIRDCHLHHRFKLETLLPLVTRNVADILKLKGKGEIKVGNDSDMVVLTRKDLQLKHVLAHGEWMMKDGKVVKMPGFFKKSDRVIHFEGQKED